MANRTAVVTGASSGIGRATAASLVARGYRVIGTSRDPDGIATSDRIPGVEYAALDLTDPAAVEAFARHLEDVDVLVNNAGESQSGPIEHLPMDAIERLFRLNVFGPVRLTQLALPGMRSRGYGRIVMVGSMLASFPLAYRSSYVAAKAALKGFAEGARLEVSPFGVEIVTVEPGSISTGISGRRTTYIGDDSPYSADFATMLTALDRNESAGISAETVAATIVEAIQSPRPRPFYAVGSRAPVVFALQRVLPRSLVLTMVARRHGLSR
jgi:short-subunit dehydrogenase